MKRTLLKIITLFITCLSWGYCDAKPKHPTMILVHGALLTSHVWAPVQSELQNNAYNVITIDTPGRLNDGVSPQEATLTKAVDKLCLVLNLQTEPVILVGHNQAGAIITQAIDHCGEKILGLVYIAAVIPWPGEQPFDQLSNQENEHFDRIAPLDNSLGLSIPDHNAPIRALFMADVDELETQKAINEMVPEPIIFAFNKLDYDFEQFKVIPKYYVKTTHDLIIYPETQDKFIKRAHIQNVILLDSSHAPFLSKPHELAEALMKINNQLSQ